MPTFDLDAARKAGYTDDQIAQGLAAQQGMDYAAAVKAGYSASDMLPSLVQGITQAKPADTAKPGMLDDIGNAVRSTGEKIGAAWLKGAQALGDAIPGLKDEGLSAPAVPQDTRSLDQLSADLNRDAVKHAPQTIPGQVAGALTYAPLGAAAPLVMGASEGVARRQALLDQGVDAATANKAGLAEGVLQGAIGALPLGEFVTGAGGKVLAKSVASSVGKAAAAGAGQSVASDAATQAYLDANGYDEQAKQFAPSIEKAAEGALFMGAFHGGMQGAHLVAGKAFDAATGNMAPQEVPAPARDAEPNQSVVDQLRTVLGEPAPATGAVPRADLQASKESTIAQAKAADPVATADAVLAAPTIDDAMKEADSIINAPLPGLHDLADGRDVNAAIDAGMDQSQTQPSTQAAADANLAGADSAFKVQPIEGQGNGIDTAGVERGTDGLGRSGGPADEVGSDLGAGRAGTGTGVIEGERAGRNLSAEKRGADAGDYRTGADGTADAKPALTPESPEVSAKKSALRDRINAGKPFSVATSGDGTVSVGATLDANGHVALELTKAEHKAFKQSQADLELAKTQEERQAAKAAEQAALRPAVDRALVGESMPVAGAQPALKADAVKQSGGILNPIQYAERESAQAGQWVASDFKDNRGQPIEQMREIDPAKLYLPELDGNGNLQPEKRRYLAGYVEKLRSGERAPAITVVEMEDGRLRVVDGHRRAMAAREVGVPVRALVSPLIDVPGEGKVPLTKELAEQHGYDSADDAVTTQPENANVPERPQVPEEAPLARGEEAAQPTASADTGRAAASDTGATAAPTTHDVAPAVRHLEKTAGAPVHVESVDQHFGTGTSFVIKYPDTTLQMAIREDGKSIFVINAHAKDPSDLTKQVRGTGRGREAMEALKKYADQTGKRLAVVGVTDGGKNFWDKIGWLKHQPIEMEFQGQAHHDETARVYDPAPAAPAKPEGKLAARRALNDRQDAVVKAAADKLAARKAEKDAAAQPAEEAPTPDANPARAEPPLSFMKKVKVDHDVYISDERRWETVKVQAHVALKSVREDIGNLEALLKCMRG